MTHTLRTTVLILLLALVLPALSFAQTITGTANITGVCSSNSYTGAIDFVPSGGTPPYTFNWSTGSTVQNPTNLAMGTYCVTISDVNAISASFCYTVPTSVTMNVHSTPELCNHQDGKAWVEITSGTPPFTILWSNSLTTDTINNLAAGNNYWVSLSDSNGCTASLGYWDSTNQHYFAVDRVLPYNYTTTTTPYHCPQFGNATVHITGGTAPYTYSWGTTPPQTTDSVSHLLPGVYTVTISDATPGCSATAEAYVNNDLPLSATASQTPEVCNYGNGTATFIPTSGTPPYTYNWNTVPPQHAATASGLHTGNYYMTVTDANGCLINQGILVNYTSPIQLNIVSVDEKCHNNQGSITLTPQVGTPPYHYHWSTADTVSALNGLTQGYYSVTVSDAQACSVVASSYINDVPSFAVNITYVPTSCINPTGSATANVTGSTGPYTYRWSTSPPQLTQTATGLAVGNYYCTVTDANGCSGVYTRDIPFVHIVAVSVNAGAAYCNTASGTAYAYPSSGTAPFTYHWSYNNANTSNISGIPYGDYVVTVTDAVGCNTVKYVYVPKYSHIHLNIGVGDASCIYNSDGQATVVATNVTPPLSYQWSNNQTTATATGLTPGWAYTVVVTDVDGCSAYASTPPVGYAGLSCAVQVSGRVIDDKDKNCTVTTGDVGIANVNVQAIPGYYDITDANGAYSFILPPGNYAINHTLPYHTFQECPVGPILLFGMTAGTDTVDNNFYDTIRPVLDLSTSYNYLTAPHPGFQHSVYINYRNEGNITTSAVLEFDYDSLVTFNTANVNWSAVDVVNRKIFFNLPNLAAGYQSNIRLYFTTAATTPLGYNLNECAHITPVLNDANFVNNDYCSSIEVTGAYDPNEKTVTPKGTGAEGFITRQDSLLHYIIRFQNTGTAFAKDVVILDSLDEDLDWGTVSKITSSHIVSPDFFQNKTLAFYFNDIYLPDSSYNEPNSHGFVSFYIKQKPNLANGTQIKNQGAIYFDYNSAIYTNQVLNTIVAPTGITAMPQAEVKIYPNPTSGALNVELNSALQGKVKLRIQNLLGQTITEEQKDVAEGRSVVTLSVAQLTPGVYILSLVDEQGKSAIAKFVKE